MAAKFSFLAIATLLGFASTASHGATLETQKPIILNDVIDDDDGTHFVVSNGRVADDFPKLVFQENESFEMLNPTHVNGEELFESDIMLSPEQREAMAQRKAIISNSSCRWEIETDGYPHVPYTFGDSEVDQAAVEGGIAHWEEHTCIKFDIATNLTEPHLRFINGSGCWSSIGRRCSKPGQDISIGKGCTSVGTVAHEIGHAIGFFHEQSRNDRDSYVVINTANIEVLKKKNFIKAPDSDVSNYSVPYDYSSDMHYGGNYFTKNGHLTLATIDPLAQELIGARSGLTHRDKLLANRMYPCIEKWLADCGETSDPCQNDGYTGADCACVCPSGTSGTNCENVDEDYYKSKLSGHSLKITSETDVMSPNYPSNYIVGRVVKWIVAPECHKVKLTFSSFRLYNQTTCKNRNLCCYWDALEIRTSNLYDGDFYCGLMITEGTSFTSVSNQMILYLQTHTDFYSGFNASVKFVKDPSCTSTGITGDTTTTPPSSKCPLEKYNDVYYWSSPNFGQENYPNDFLCNMKISSGPGLALIKFQPLFLQKPKKRVCKDKVTIFSTYGKETSYCGARKAMTIMLPSTNLQMAFESDSSITRKGFNISVESIESPCHETIVLSSLGEEGEFKTPFYPKKDKNKKRMCEVWFVAPSSYRIQLNFMGFKLKKPCTKNNLIINPEGDSSYPVETSSRHCGKAKPKPMTSIDNEIYLLYTASKPNIGFAVRYKVVE